MEFVSDSVPPDSLGERELVKQNWFEVRHEAPADMRSARDETGRAQRPVLERMVSWQGILRGSPNHCVRRTRGWVDFLVSKNLRRSCARPLGRVPHRIVPMGEPPIMQYCIEKRVLARVPTIEIDQARFAELVRARQGVSETLGIEEKYDLLVENYLEFTGSLLAMANTLNVRPWTTWSDSRGQLGTIHRHLLNLLSAERLYLDQVAHHLSSLFGKDSEAFVAFDTERRSLHGEHLGYRVIEALRNHIQHRGLPVGASHHHWRAEMLDGSIEKRTAVRPFLMLQPLEDDEKFPRRLLRELAELNEEKVELNPLVREWMKAMARLQEHLRGAVDDSFQAWQEAIETAVRDYQALHGDDIIGLSAVEKDASGVSHRHVWLGLEPAERLVDLRTRNTTRPFVASVVTEA